MMKTKNKLEKILRASMLIVFSLIIDSKLPKTNFAEKTFKYSSSLYSRIEPFGQETSAKILKLSALILAGEETSEQQRNCC